MASVPQALDSTWYKKNTPYNTYLFSSWKHPSTGSQVLDVMILLPSGASENDMTDVLVRKDGMVLLLTIAWPAALSDLAILTKIAQRHDNDPATPSAFVGGVTDSFKMLKININSNIQRQHTIALPHKVLIHIAFIMAVETKYGGTVMHVRLNGLADSFASGMREKSAIVKVDFLII